MISAIAIDDEPPALKVIESFCERIDFIDLQKTFNKPAEALKHLRKFPVDLIFLDINMPSMTGIELYRSIEQQAMVIFTTAYSDYAVEGFNLNAVDYLLKPFTFDRFSKAINKAEELYKLRNRSEDTQKNHLLIRADYSLIKIEFNEILHIEALDDYLKIHLRNRKTIVARMTMKAMQQKLPADSFVRIHRSFIVPYQEIRMVRNKTVFLESAELPLGASYEESFLSEYKRRFES